MDLGEYVLGPLRRDEEFILYRGQHRSPKDGEPLSILLLAPVSQRPAPETVKKLKHEYSVTSELDAEWAVRPLALSQHKERLALVLDDPGGQPLNQLIHGPMEMGQFLRIATALAGASHQLHKRGLIHKDLKPHNVLVDPGSCKVWLTGFGIASRLPREHASPEPPEFIAGTLAYMAPEQTGRMNRSIDARSDLYALGVTLYEALTGVLPFMASDPMEWVHFHIARSPVPPSERHRHVSSSVSAIIMKLLAKNPEDRYQTALGAENDLRRCLLEWNTHGRIDDFVIGQHDTPNRLLIPEKLYGRAPEIETLCAAFDRVVSSGKTELVLVSGYSGIGKSSVVNELQKMLVPTRGLFASGKFDQYKRDIPYSTLVQASQNLVRPLLSKSDAELANWRGAFLETLAPNARLMTDLIPELKLIIGDQPPVPEIEPQQAQSRFQLVFRRFISVFARPEHPLALFLDDLQWLDTATLEVLQDLLTQPDVHQLMLIGAYRDNEVNAAHPLMRRLEAIRQAGGKIQEIALAPLTSGDFAGLIADSLHCSAEAAVPLAQLTHQKTAGNPFFAIQFIYALSDEALLTFDYRQGQWSWDVDRIHAKGYTDNVVDLMVSKLSRLPIETQQALQLLACMGNNADFALLEMVSQEPNEEIHRALWEAVRTGLVFRSDDSYRFLHDRVQEAAYSLIPEESRAKIHLRLGKLLVARTSPEKLEDHIFEIVNQLNRATGLITSADERQQLAVLNLIAGKRSKVSTAYASALKYLVAGSAALGNDRWERLHELSFQLELYRSECEFLIGELAIAEERLSALSSRAADNVERATVASLQVDLYTTLDQSARAVSVCLDYLAHLGIKWSAHPTDEEVRGEYDRIWSRLGSRGIEELIDLPSMIDGSSLAMLDVLTKLFIPALFTDANLLSLATCRAVSLSIELGISDASCVAFVWLGQIAGPHFGSYEAGFRFGQLGYELVERRGLQRFKPRTYMVLGHHVVPWTKHVRAGRDLLRRAFETANNIGDLTFAAYSCINLNTNLLIAGDPLEEVQEEAMHGLQYAEKLRFGFALGHIRSQLGLVRTLRGITAQFGSFNDDQFDELRFERHLASDPALAQAECFYWIRKLQARFLAGDHASALDASSRAQRLLWSAPSNLEHADYEFYSALAQAASWHSAPSDRRQQHFKALSAHSKQLEIWAKHCPENFENRASLVGAEIARIEGRDLDAMGLYEQAIRSAHANGFVHNEALANELAARFYAGRGFERIADTYLRDARYGYLRWGAAGKVRQLEELNPQLRENKQPTGVASTIAKPIEHLDLATVIKVSQAVTGEIVLEKLIDTLMRTAIEHAGAERGVLILPHGAGHRIAAEAATSGDGVVVRTGEVSPGELPESIIHFVVRSQEWVILDEAAANNTFSADNYIRQRRARSILCVPLINQGKLTAVLYLENNLAPGVFTPDRIAILKLLASQAAMSLENSHLYRDLEQREAKIRRLVEANIVGIFIWDHEDRIVEANDEFLRIVGYDRDDLKSGRIRWVDLTPPEWLELDIGQRVPELKTTGSLQPFEKEYFRKDGSRVPVLIGVTSFEETGNQGVAFVLDLSEQKRTEEALRHSESYLAQAQKIAHVGSWAWEVGGRKALYLSEEWYRVYGFDPKDGMPTWEDRLKRVHPDDRAPWQAAIERAIAEKSDYDVEFRILPPHTPVRFIHSVGHPVLGSSGEVLQFVGIAMDITERKRAEEERQRLRQAETDLAYMSRVSTMGELTASLAHEIKQPIGAAVTNAEACARLLDRDQPDIAEAREAALEMVKDARRAAHIIDRVRSMYRRGSSELEMVDVNEVIGEMAIMLHNQANRYSVTIRTDLAKSLPRIMADRIQLQQVLMNLMLNGIEAMRDTTGELSIKSQLTQDGQLLISITDTGVGLPTANPDRIFDAFFTTKPQGTGLGLAITRSIVASHGGRLWATANPGKGATFHFTLPSRVALSA